MSAHPPQRPRDEEPLVRIAARRAVRRMREDAATPEFGRMLLYQAFGAAGDALVALALAGSLFFSVPESTARDRVALYLLLTMAPFAIVAPLLSKWLDRHRGSMRIAMIIASRGVHAHRPPGEAQALRGVGGSLPMREREAQGKQ